jgi:aminoglycoside 6'-N-acetyltransferase I
LDCEFTPLSEQTIERFAPLYVAVFNEPPWRDGWSLSIATERLQSFARDPLFRGLGVLQDHNPIGLVLGCGERWSTGWVFHLKEMCVATTHQGHGVGRAMLAQLEALLRLSNFTSVHLQTGRNAPARKFYEAAGYSEYGNVPLRKKLA